MNSEKNSTWGGARRSGVTKKNVTFSIDIDLAEKLPVDRSKLVNELLKKYFKKGENKS